ncbi:reverse transcriptase domain-containing protein [Tanacetum coccineum]
MTVDVEEIPKQEEEVEDNFKELTLEENIRIKTSIQDPPTDLELKPLPKHLEYDFLEKDSLLPVVISALLKDDEKKCLVFVLKRYKEAFSLKTSDISGISPSFCKHKINFEDDAKPVIQRQRRHKPNMKEVVKKEIIKLLDAGIIYPIEDSPWMSHVLCVPKKGGMNIVTNEKNEPIPTRIVTGWRRCMIAIFQDMLETSMEVFIYDVLVFGDSFDKCLVNLEQMLIRCKQAHLVLNWEKCHFMVTEGIVLGHKVYSAGLEVDKAKIDVIAIQPPPTSVKAIRSFLGHAEFYCRFIKDFSKISRLMTKLLEKDAVFDFNKECIEAFESLKEKLTNAPIMISPDWSQPFELMCNASDFAVRAVLGQREGKHFHPIYFASKTLNNAQQNYTITEKELLAVVFAFNKFRSYLVLSKTIVFTDHYALKYLFAKQDAKPRLIRWILLLQEFNIEIKNKKGAENLTADHLSHLENPNLEELREEDIDDNLPDETLMNVSLNDEDGTPWFADFANYLDGKILRKVILNGDDPIQVTINEKGVETKVPPKTAQALLARQRERKAKSIMLLAIPDEYQLRFHAIKDAKTLWAAIKSRFGGNVEYKKMQKNVLKQQFENFSLSDIEGLDKAYDRFQKLIRLLEGHALIMRNKDGIDDLDIDDLYNNLKVFEADIKGSSGSSSNSQNVAFLSAEDISSSFDKTKVECFNCHRRGHFARECRAPRNQGNRNGDAGYRSKDKTRGTVPVETSNALVVEDNALIVQDGLGYD